MKEICAICGKKFDVSQAEDRFDEEFWGLSYQKFREPLCGHCAVYSVRDKEKGLYFEHCGACHKDFDLFEEMEEFRKYSGEPAEDELMDYWGDKIRCCECALKKMKKER